LEINYGGVFFGEEFLVLAFPKSGSTLPDSGSALPNSGNGLLACASPVLDCGIYQVVETDAKKGRGPRLAPPVKKAWEAERFLLPGLSQQGCVGEALMNQGCPDLQ